MKYGHAYQQNRDFTREEWDLILCDMYDLLAKLPEWSNSASGAYSIFPLFLADDSGDWDSEPLLNENHILLNGKNGPANLHGDCLFLAREKVDTGGYIEIETKGKPYDLVVCAALLVAEHQAPGVLSPITTGGRSCWAAAVKWVESVCGYRVDPWWCD